MKKRFALLMLLCFILGGITATYASSTIKLIANGKSILSYPSPQIIRGHVMVPLKVVSDSLGAEVKWDANKQEVQINSGMNIWDEPFDPWENEYEPTIVVSRYLALLQDSITGSEIIKKNYSNIFSKAVCESKEPWTIVWHTAQPGMGQSYQRLSYKILDGHRIVDSKGNVACEIAARINYFNPNDAQPNLFQSIKVYKVISETYINENGGEARHLVIASERTLKETRIDHDLKPNFYE